MVKFYSSSYTYDYPFPAVSLAYFLRYPNPYSRHVASTDTIARHYDPLTQRLTTIRLHLKKSRLPPAVLKLLPRSTLGASEDGSTQSFILEKSVVDAKEGWMQTESRNLDWNNVLSVIERQSYRRPEAASHHIPADEIKALQDRGVVGTTDQDKTECSVSVTLKSRIGEQIRKRRQRWGEQATGVSVQGEGEEAKRGFWASWTPSGALRTAVETISLQRTERSQPKAKQGMNVVLERLRDGGLVRVLEGMREDRAVEL